MPINPVVPSLVVYFEVDYTELIELNHKYPQFLHESLTKTGYSTLHLLPKDVSDAFAEFDSWPRPDRDLIYFKMTQKRQHAPSRILNNVTEAADLQKGVINVVKFSSAEAFMQQAETLAAIPDCCFTVLYVINKCEDLSKDIKSFIDFQLSLQLVPSALRNCPEPDWNRLAVSFSRGSSGEFRVRPAIHSTECGLFGLEKWRGFPGGITQLYSLKAELSSIIGITGKYGD